MAERGKPFRCCQRWGNGLTCAGQARYAASPAEPAPSRQHLIQARRKAGAGDVRPARSGVLNYTITSGARELLKWIAVVLMTGDHVAKVLGNGYIPVVSELGRIAFPLFALVLAYNLAQPGADLLKSVRRLLLWGVIAQPAWGLAFGHWLPFNVLFSFALAAAVIWSIQRHEWVLLGMCAVAAPALVEYNWTGLILVVAAWWLFTSPAAQQRPLAASTQDLREARARRGARIALLVLAFGPLCWLNGNGWALLALPIVALLAKRSVPVPRTRWAFYLYYVGHLALLAAVGAAIASGRA